MPQATGIGSDSTPRYDRAMLNSVLRSVFARPSANAGTPSQRAQGNMGQLGAVYGRTQGPIGAAVPQLGSQQTPGAASAGTLAQPSASKGTQPQGLEAMLPALLLGGLLMHFLGPMLGNLGMGSGGLQSTSREPGQI